MRLAQRRLVRQPYAVGENADVFSQPALLVEHIAAHMRAVAEQDSSASPTVAPSACNGPSGTT